MDTLIIHLLSSQDDTDDMSHCVVLCTACSLFVCAHERKFFFLNFETSIDPWDDALYKFFVDVAVVFIVIHRNTMFENCLVHLKINIFLL